ASALFTLLAPYLPELEEIPALSCLERGVSLSHAEVNPHVEWGVPGRKGEQIAAFVAAVEEYNAPLLEWCGGKGHLGRRLAAERQQAVVTLEWNAQLCEAGRQLAARTRMEQHFSPVDVLHAEVDHYLAGHHVVALHACGELHRHLVRRAVALHVPALDVAPCCYYHGAPEAYQPFNQQLQLMLSRDDLRLTVTETVTAAPREVALRDREMAWKLGFIPGDCGQFCRLLAQREGVRLPGEVAWQEYEAYGWQRQRETMRLSLVRQAFRRALELWLVLDMATFLEQSSYEVALTTFCPRHVTPRNILLSARRSL
ncbi:MAG: hypothetical protein FD130_1369, partial [Halothiobacillaceae bacterium]